MSSITPPQPTEDYKRLQLIEQKVISCVQIAAQVTEHFSRVGRTAELAGPVQQLCAKFMNTIAEALQLVKEGAEASSGDHRLQLHAYHSLARAHINTEKLQVLKMHLDAMQAELGAAVAAAGSGPDGADTAGPGPGAAGAAAAGGRGTPDAVGAAGTAGTASGGPGLGGAPGQGQAQGVVCGGGGDVGGSGEGGQGRGGGPGAVSPGGGGEDPMME